MLAGGTGSLAPAAPRRAPHSAGSPVVKKYIKFGLGLLLFYLCHPWKLLLGYFTFSFSARLFALSNATAHIYVYILCKILLLPFVGTY